MRRQEKVEELKSSIPELGRGHRANQVCVSLAQGEMGL